MNRLLILSPLLLAPLLAACGDASRSAPVSDADARAVLDQVIAWSREGSLLEHCPEIGSPVLTCRRDLGFYGEDNVPPDAPVIIDSIEVVPSGSNQDHGRVLVLCGTDAAGRQFQTGFLVYHDQDGRVVVPYPVYWSGAGIILAGAGGTATAAPATDPVADCAAAGAFD